MKTFWRALVVGGGLLTSAAARAQTTPMDCAAHHAGVNERGDHVMGFDHEKTRHHFRLTKTGGVIEVLAIDSEDTGSRDAIRGHLAHIARMFSEGNFEAPMLIHGRVPPGVPTMQKEKTAIAWKYEDVPAGGRILATTENAQALSAVHEFLRFQIEDHETGDSPEIDAPERSAGGK